MKWPTNPHPDAVSQPSLLANPRVKKWVKEMLEKREAISRAIGMPLETMLGCGHWGCVVDSTDPWVVKLTIDPNEAPIWEKILRLIDEEDYGGDGVVRVKGLYQLQPGVKYGGRMKRVYAIVREEVNPVFTDSLPGVPVSKGPGLWLSPRTNRELGLPAEPIMFFSGYGSNLGKLVPQSGGWEVQETDAVREFLITMRGLELYRSAAFEWFKYGGGPDYERLKDRIERIAYSMGGYIGNAMSETLLMLLSNDVVLRDLHLFNVGWRVHSRINGSEMPRTICIFDPGHTPAGRGVAIPVASLQGNPYMWSR